MKTQVIEKINEKIASLNECKVSSILSKEDALNLFKSLLKGIEEMEEEEQSLSLDEEKKIREKVEEAVESALSSMDFDSCIESVSYYLEVNQIEIDSLYLDTERIKDCIMDNFEL
jgi:hypothetical protein